MTKKLVFPRRTSVDDILSQADAEGWADIEPRVREIVESVRIGGEASLRRWAAELDDFSDQETLFLNRDALASTLEQLTADERELLTAVAERIRAFAEAQKSTLSELDLPVPGGRAGHRIAPVEHVGCYAPSGRYPLPSSVLMTVIPARVAGAGSVWVASPRPDRMICAAAAIAGADGILVAGGAQAVGALAYGVGPVPPSDVVVGPGNRYVTAAKKLIAGSIRIDMLAGPSELVIIADDSADPGFIAADLLAQAEHDDRAIPILISLGTDLVERVESELERQLETLPTRETATAALKNGGSVTAHDIEAAANMSDRIAPEHLQICVRNPASVTQFLHHYGSLFLGESSAEVFGDYGVGPNHVLPTGRSARSTAGLSVLTFLRIQTWLELDDTDAHFSELLDQSAWLARVEGLEAHARAVEKRRR